MVKSLPKPTADDIRKISEYNRQVATQKLNELKEKKAKSSMREGKEDAVDDDALYQRAYEKALDLNDFGHGEVLDPTAVAREAQGIFEDWKEDEEEEEYARNMELEMSNLDSWEDYSDGEEDW